MSNGPPLSAVERIRPSIRAMQAYALAPLRAKIKVNQNESPFDLPESVKSEALRRIAARPWSRYPDFEPLALREALAAHSGWRPDGVLVGNGSNELIQLAMTCCAREGMNVVTTPPTFAVYRKMINALGSNPLDVPLRADFSFDVASLMDARLQAGVMILCSPNNPTGTSIADGDLAALLEGFDGIAIVDEAYAEFAGRSAVPLLNRFENLIVLRTFSKAYASAGLRIGYLLARPELARELNKVRLPYNLNIFSQTVAETVLEQLPAFQPAIELLREERGRLFGMLSRIDGLEPTPSDANFLLVKTKIEPGILFRELHERGILIRDVSKYPMLSQHVRISIGSPEENDAVARALEEVMRNG